MGKLRTAPALLRAAPPRLARATDAHGHSAVLEPWRGWYSLKRWLDLRQRVFVRDVFTCQCGCGTLIGKPRERIADHIEPHGGDPDLFWDLDNVQTLWKPHHDSWKQALERQAKSRGRGV